MGGDTSGDNSDDPNLALVVLFYKTNDCFCLHGIRLHTHAVHL